MYKTYPTRHGNTFTEAFRLGKQPCIEDVWSYSLRAGKSKAGLSPEFAARGMSELIPTAETFQQNQCYESFPLEEHGEFLRSWIFPLYS